MEGIKTYKNLTAQSQIRGKRGSKDQKSTIKCYMEENLNFAHERFESDCGVSVQKQKWQALTETLNSLSSAKKSAEQWKQYWRDLKRNVKVKAAEEKRKLEESGVNGLISLRSTLDDYDRRVISIITPDVIDGDGESQDRGLNRSTISYSDMLDPAPQYLVEVEENNVSVLEPPTTVLQRSPPRKRRRLSRPPFKETAGKLDAYINFEKEKLKFEKEKFEYQKEQEREKRQMAHKLAVETRKVTDLENIGQSLKMIVSTYTNVEYLDS